MPFIIDGHNLLHAIQKSGELYEPVSDVGMCNLLARYFNKISENAQVIFDGTGPPDKSAFDNLRNLEVIFSGLRIDADTIIEDKIKTSTAPKRLIAISSDRRIAVAARKRKVKLLKSLVFWEQVQKQLNRKQRPKEPREKREGLTESETQQWLKFFDLEQ